MIEDITLHNFEITKEGKLQQMPETQLENKVPYYHQTLNRVQMEDLPKGTTLYSGVNRKQRRSKEYQQMLEKFHIDQAHKLAEMVKSGDLETTPAFKDEEEKQDYILSQELSQDVEFQKTLKEINEL